MNTGHEILAGMALSNALVALAGALFAQSQGGADISMGIGTIVIGLAAVIIGETILPARRLILTTLAVVVGRCCTASSSRWRSIAISSV